MASSISWLWGSSSSTKPTSTSTTSSTTPAKLANGNGVAHAAAAKGDVPQIAVVDTTDAGDGAPTPHASPKIETTSGINGVQEAKVLASDGVFPSLTSPQRVDLPSAPTISVNSPTTSPTASPVMDGSDRTMPPPPVPATNGIGGLKAAVKAQKKAIKRQLKERLAPGHSQMDWAILKTKGLNLRGVDQIMRVTPSMLAQHNTKEDAWSVFFGKVYNITPYMSYHPGGEKKLIRVAGKDGTRLFVHEHEWINIEAMMDECFVGFLVPEPAAED